MTDSLRGYQIGALCSPYIQGDNCNQQVDYFNVQNKTIHPDYNSFNLDNDFALVRLDGVVSSSITPVGIDDGSYSSSYTNGKGLWTVGFGIADNGSVVDHLRHVEVGYVDNESCITDYSYEERNILDSMMCATDSGKDSCNGGELFIVSYRIASYCVHCFVSESDGREWCQLPFQHQQLCDEGFIPYRYK